MTHRLIGFLVTLTLAILVVPLAADDSRQRTCTGSVCFLVLPQNETQ
jgi:hypothetical protein